MIGIKKIFTIIAIILVLVVVVGIVGVLLVGAIFTATLMELARVVVPGFLGL